MPQTIEKQEDILVAMSQVDVLAGAAEEIRQQWLTGYFDKSSGKCSGPLVRLLVFDAGETVLQENDWGGNNFLILVNGALDVYMTDRTSGARKKVNEIKPGESFGEMSLFAGVPRVASVVASGTGQALPRQSLVLEIARSAFRGLERDAPQLIARLGEIYELRALDTAIEQIGQATAGFTDEQLDQLQKLCTFKVYGRSHLLCSQGQQIDKLLLIKNGWVRRSRNSADISDAGIGWARVGPEGFELDFLGPGNVLGLSSLSQTTPSVWGYNATVMLRTEVLEIDLPSLRANIGLCETVQKEFARFAVLPDDRNSTSSETALEAIEEVITTGIVEAENVLVMDMDLCIRCGNCSFACEKVHGQSRLVRRGIHIERAPKLQARNLQHLLVPEVCIHCQDPECLTSCPTDAIARRDYGQIDINPTKCTGCMACARLCPYNAISMITEVPTSRVAPGFASRLSGWLGATPASLPAPVTAKKSEVNLVAVKCNLCADTPLNPAGKRKPAYSCEENCPTGALVRVNPLEYFDEVKGRLAFVFQSPTMALGRNIHRSDPLRQFSHVIGVVLLLISFAAGLWAWKVYGFNSRLGVFPLSLRWLSGLIGAAGIAGSIAYSARRRIYRHRAGPLRYWLLAHIYLGSLAAVAILLHGGSHAGGPFTTALMVMFDLVVLTGFLGIGAYQIAPRLLTSIEGDPLLLEDLETRRQELAEDLKGIKNENEELQQLLNGPRRRFASVSYLLRQIWRREELNALLADAREEYGGASLAEAERKLFVEYVEKMATSRRLDALIYLHRLMSAWLRPHIIAASLMLALLIVHILQVTIFALR